MFLSPLMPTHAAIIAMLLRRHDAAAAPLPPLLLD